MYRYFFEALAISFAVTTVVIYIAHRYHLFIDHAEELKPQNHHTVSTPRSGGIALISGLGLLLFSSLGSVLYLSVFLAFLSGIYEDFNRSLSPQVRLVLQAAAALSAVWFSHAVVTYLGLGIHMPYWIGALFSLFAIVGMMNAINIIDGFNGLAGGIGVVILLSFGITAYRVGDTDILYIIIVSTGAICGFLLLNYPKGRIFLGDGGAYLLGFLTAIIGIFLAGNYDDVSPWYVLAVLIYPVWEVVFSIVRRKIEGKSALEADASHLHTLIYRHITRNNPLTATAIIVAQLPFIAIATLYSHHSLTNIVIIALFILCYLFAYRMLLRKEFIS